MKKIAVVGSLNMDFFIETDAFPDIGETVLGKGFFKALGGKGANQAIAAARLGGSVSLFGSVGTDESGKVMKKKIESEKVNLSFLNVRSEVPSGAAFIEICKSENRILVVQGANLYTDREYIKKVISPLMNHDIVMFQLETPLEILEYLVPILYEKGKVIVVNPAPAQSLSTKLLKQITYLVPNEHEYGTVVNEKLSMDEVLKKYPNKLVITCGTNGVKYFDGTQVVHIPAIQVRAIDTTGAGDTFCGAFAAGLSEEKPLKESIEFACIAAGLSVKKKGAQTGMPSREEITTYMKAGGSI